MRWTWLRRDGWGFLRTVETGIELPESEARGRNDLMRQQQAGWLALESTVPMLQRMDGLR